MTGVGGSPTLRPTRRSADPVGALVGRWMAHCHRRPWVVLAALAVLLALAGIAATRLGIDSDSSRMLAPDLPAQQAAHALNEKFPSLKSTIIVTVSADQADAADLAVAELAHTLPASPVIEAVFAPSVDPFLAANGFLYRDMDEIERLFTRLSKSANLLAHLRADPSLDGFAGALGEAIVLAERAEIGADALERLFAESASVIEAQTLGRARPFAWSTVLDDDPPGPVARLIWVTPRLDTTRLIPARPALSAIEVAIAALPSAIAGDVEIAVTGEPALRAEELSSVTRSIGLSLVLSAVLVGLLLLAGLGSWRRVVLTLGLLAASLVLTAGFAGIAVGTLNLISVAFVVLMVGLGVDFAIHILAHLGELRRDGSSLADAVRLTGERSGLALGLSALTTALGFLAFAATDFVGMAQLGIIGAGGVLIAFVTAASVLPAAAALNAGLVDGASTPLARLMPRRAPRWAPWAVIALGCAAVWPAFNARFDADPMALRNPDAPSVRAFQALAADADTTPYRASILAAYAVAADELAHRFEDAPGIGAAINLGDLVPRDQDTKLMLLDLAAPSIDHAVAGQPTALAGDGDGNAKGKGLASLAARLDPIDGMAQRLKRAIEGYLDVRTRETDQQLTERIFRSFGLLSTRVEAMLGAEPITVTTLPEALRARYLAPDGTYRVEILPDGGIETPTEVRAFVEAVTDIVPQATGGPVQLVAAGRTVASAMLIATLIAAAVTALLALVATRRPSDALAIILPLALAGLVTAAFSALAGMPFNYANVIVLPLMIGVGVDSGIHIALRERRAPGAVLSTSTPGAVVLASLTTVAAFATLALSDHRGTASMGALLGVSILATMLSVLVLTPWLIRRGRSVGF